MRNNANRQKMREIPYLSFSFITTYGSSNKIEIENLVKKIDNNKDKHVRTLLSHYDW